MAIPWAAIVAAIVIGLAIACVVFWQYVVAAAVAVFVFRVLNR